MSASLTEFYTAKAPACCLDGSAGAHYGFLFSILKRILLRRILRLRRVVKAAFSFPPGEPVFRSPAAALKQMDALHLSVIIRFCSFAAYSAAASVSAAAAASPSAGASVPSPI